VTDLKSKPKRLPISGKRCLREVALVWRGGWARLRTRLWIIVVACTLSAGLAWVGTDQDRALMEKMRLDGTEATERAAEGVADFVSNYTSDLTLCIPVSLMLWTMGAVRGRARWRRLGLACLMATALAGLTVQGVKRVVGRPRPDVPDAYLQQLYGSAKPLPLYGPTSKSKLHGFPSGHTASSTATSVTWIATNPVMAVPGIAYAASVGWSRMQLRKHYPIDVAGGAIIGIVFGLCFASTVPGSIVQLTRKRGVSRLRK
jgi:membrane-associated phospholipid phosphatase